MKIYGVDFSGACDAGKKIWIASGHIKEDGLAIVSCNNLHHRFNVMHRDDSLQQLCEFVGTKRNAAFGLDFPFGLPKDLVQRNTWSDFVLSFPDQFISPEAFRKSCCNAAQGEEKKRCTDIENKTPFSPYNLRLYKQTFYGIHDVLNPLMKDRSVYVLPMQKPLSDKPWLLEVCPASTLKKMGLYQPYKGKGNTLLKTREFIIDELEKKRSNKNQERFVTKNYH